MTTYFSRPIVVSYWLLLFLVDLLLLTSPAFSLQPGPLVRKVEVQFDAPNPQLSKARILANLSVKCGVPYNWRLAQQDIRSLYGTGFFSNVRVFSSPFLGGVKIIFLVKGFPSVSAVDIHGANQVPIARIRKEIATKVGQTLKEIRLAEDRQKIIKLYRDRHFGQVQVTFTVCPTSNKSRVRVLFKIVEGTRIVVGKISFIGNNFLSSRKLRAALKTKSRNLLSFFKKSDCLTSEQLSEDQQNIRLIYCNHGFADARCIGIQVKTVSQKKVEVIYRIEEGVKYYVRSLRFDGVTHARSRILLDRCKMKQGSLYTRKGLQTTLKAVNDFYGENGYLDCATVARIIPAESTKVDLLFRIDEGKQYYINLIDIQGNTRTKDFVVRRELALKPGELFNIKRMEASRIRLQNLDYFSRVELLPKSTAIQARKDLGIFLEEKNTGSFNVGVGYSSIDSLIGFVELQQTNFDLFSWPTFRGAGQRLRVRMQYGLERKDFMFSLVEPWFLNRRFLVGVDGYYHDADYFSTVYDQLCYGGAVHFRVPLASCVSMRGEYRGEGIYIHNVAHNVGTPIKSSQGQHIRSSFSIGLDYDTRDSLFLPRRGTVIRYTSFLSGGIPLGGSVQDYGLRLAAARYMLLPMDCIFMVTAKVAVVSAWGSRHKLVPIFDRLHLGGSSDLRGFDFRDVGPKDKFGNAIGGSSMFCSTLEVTFPILPRIRGACFTDWGSVNVNGYDFSAKHINGDVGIGIRLDLPMGTPVRFDFGYPVRYDKYNRNQGRFQLNIGYQF